MRDARQTFEQRYQATCKLMNLVETFKDSSVWFDGVERTTGYVVADGRFGKMFRTTPYEQGLLAISSV